MHAYDLSAESFLGISMLSLTEAGASFAQTGSFIKTLKVMWDYFACWGHLGHVSASLRVSLALTGLSLCLP